MKAFYDLDETEVYEEMARVYEASIRAMDDFYSEADIAYCAQRIRESGNDGCGHRFCMTDDYPEQLMAFLIIDGICIDMLCVHPDFWGEGDGSFLLDEAINRRHVEALYVYEQNQYAVDFCKKRGFVEKKRVECDGAPEQPYPQLYMVLENPAQKIVKITPDTVGYSKLLRIGNCSLNKDWRCLYDCNMLGLEYKGQPIGVAAVDEKKGRIMNFAILPEFQGQKFGNYLMYFLLNSCRDKFRWLRIAVSGDKVPFFKKYYFKYEGKIKWHFKHLHPRSRRIHRRRNDPWDLVFLKKRIGK